MDPREREFQSFVLGVGRRYPVEVFLQSLSSPPDVHHASGVLVGFEQRVALLTADHVLRKYEAMAASARTLLQASGVTLSDPASRIAWSDGQNDLALIDLTMQEALQTGAQIHRPVRWPPPLPPADEFVVIVGFPKELRKQVGPREQEFGDFAGVYRVRASYANHFTCQLERDSAIPLSEKGVPPVGAELGGMSGGPVFSFSRQQLDYSLVGVIKEDWPSVELLVIQGLTAVPRLGN